MRHGARTWNLHPHYVYIENAIAFSLLQSPRQKLTLRKFHGTRRAPETDGNIDPVEAWDRRIRKAMVAAFSLTAVVYWILMLVEMNAV